MLVFIIPLKSQANSQSWEKVCQLFERSVRSVCQQTSPNFQAIAVCHDKPDIQFRHPNLRYQQVDFPVPARREGDRDHHELDYLNQQRVDKGRKVMAGLDYARQFEPSHVMIVDADDCVSKSLATFVEQRPQENGWLITSGYRYEEGSNCVYFKRNFYRMCGTCNIIRFDLMKVPENPEYNRGYGYYKYYIDHEKVKQVLIEQGTALNVLPFPGAVYVTKTSENMYFSAERLHQGLLRWLNYRPLTDQLRDEFHLNPIAHSLPVMV